MADLEALQTFIAVVRSGSFASAARELNLSPAMVGRRIQALEERHRVRLIERTTRTQRLTDEGEEFLARAEAVVEAANSLDDMIGASKPSGRIRLSAPTTFGGTQLPAILAAFAADYPDIRFEIALTDRPVDLVSEGYDVAIRIGRLPSSGLIARRVGTYRFTCCASPGFLADRPLPTHPSELPHLPCVLNMNLKPRNRWIFHGNGGEVAVEITGGIEIDNDIAQRQLALLGAGVVYVPLDLVADDFSEGRLVQLLPDWELHTLPIHILTPSRHLVPRRVTAFILAASEALGRKNPR